MFCTTRPTHAGVCTGEKNAHQSQGWQDQPICWTDGRDL